MSKCDWLLPAILLGTSLAISAQAQTTNHDPVCYPKTLAVSEAAALTAFEFNPITLAPACSDADGDTLSVINVTAPGTQPTDTNGQLLNAIKLNDTFSDNGQLTVAYTISDGNGGTTSSSVTVIHDIPPQN